MRHLVFGLVMALLLSSSAISAGSGANAFITNSGMTTSGATSGVTDVSVIDAAANVLGTAIPVANLTHGVAMDSQGNRAYAASAPGTPGAVYAIDVKSKQVVGSVTFPVTSLGQVFSPFGLAVSPDGKRLFMSHIMMRTINGRRRPFAGYLSVVDVTAGANGTVAMSVVGAPLSLGGATTGVAVSPLHGGAYSVYVANGDGSIAMMDPVSLAFTSVLVDPANGVSLVGVAVSSDGARLYAVGSLRDARGGLFGKLWVVTTASMGPAMSPIVSAVTVGNGPFGVAVSPNGQRVFVTNSVGNPDSGGNMVYTASVIDTSTLAQVPGSPFTVGNGPQGVSVRPDGAVAYVVNRYDPFPSVSVLDGTTGRVTGTIPLPQGSNPVAFGSFFSVPLGIDVQIHVVPTVNLKAQGSLPVIIYGAIDQKGTVIFDVHDITLNDFSDLRLAIGSINWPVKMKGNGEPMVNYGDFNGDGAEDVMVHFNMGAGQAVQTSKGDCPAMLNGTATIQNGSSRNEVSIAGCDRDVKLVH